MDSSNRDFSSLIETVKKEKVSEHIRTFWTGLERRCLFVVFQF